MKGLNLTLLLLISSISILAQVNFQQILPPSPSPQILADFRGVLSGDIAFADVDGNGTEDVLITGVSGTKIAKLYLNDGAGNFTENLNTPFIGVLNGSIAFSDVDGNGSLDVLITGQNTSQVRSSTLYINDGAGNFTVDNNTPFEGVTDGSIAFSDVDGNGTNDVLITGRNSSNAGIAKIYSNDGSGNFTELTGGPVIEGVRIGAIAFSDIDGNLTEDLLITGKNSSFNNITNLYKNDGSGNFTLVEGTPFTDVYDGSVTFADVDGNGTSDVLITGTNISSAPTSKLYINDGNGNFTEDVEVPFIGVNARSSAAFSDVDGNGSQDVLITGAGKAKLYLNDGSGNFTESAEPYFDPVSISDIEFSDVDGNGTMDVLITGRGSSNQPTSILYLNEGNGVFQKVKVSPFEGVSKGAVGFSDVDGNGTMDVLITGSTNQRKIRLYLNGGTGDFTEAENLPFTAVNDGSIAFSDIDGNGTQDVLITGSIATDQGITKLYTNDGNGNFTEKTGIPFEAVYLSAVAFADVDGNGIEDLLITGRSDVSQISKLYMNDGNGNFTEKGGTPFESIFNGTANFGDLDGNGSLDLIITGRSGLSVPTAKTYLNDGAGNFTEKSNSALQGVVYSAVAIADIDGNGSQDLLITGHDGPNEGSATAITKLYTNDGNANFTEVTSVPFDNVYRSSVGFSDVNRDGSPDLFISGRLNNSTSTAKLYTNDGSGNFTEVAGLPFEAVFNSAIAFSDVTGNDIEDLLITGEGSQVIAKIYKNAFDETAPVITSPLVAEITENITTTAYSATADETVSFSLGTTKDESLFSISENAISFKAAPDFENPADSDANNIYLLDLTATDLSGNSTTVELSITVIDADEVPPNFTSDLSTTVAENTEGSFYTITADEAVTFSLGDSKDEAVFSLSVDAISFITAPDLNNPLDQNADNVYLLDITATDQAGNTNTSELEITVISSDVTPPTITSANTAEVLEGFEGIIYTATADETVTFALGISKDEGLFNISNNTIRFKVAPDFENPQDGNGDNLYLVDLIATDLAGNVNSKELSISVNDLDEIAPLLTSADSVSVQENTEGIIYTATANEEVSFSLGNIKDENLFILTNSTISFVNAPDFETPLDGDVDNVYLIDIIAIDQADNIAFFEVVITVTDLDELAPIFTSSDSVMVEENTVGIIYSAEADEEVDFSLGDSKDEALFTLTANELQFIDAPDFETPLDKNADNIYILDFIAMDDAGNETTLEVSVTVVDIEEAPLSSTEAISFEMYPNPFRNSLFINQINVSKDAFIYLRDLSGKTQKTFKYDGYSREFDLSELRSGVYIISIPVNGKTTHFKVVKE